ncbi:MAG: NAD-binding protein, partial [Burkholderiaceae bacterium]|nr:NAD-binding protein [Burkholderiaceae bacterium]
GLSLFMTPLLARIGRAIGDKYERDSDEKNATLDEGPLAAARGGVIIAGFGRVGQLLARLLSSQGIAYVAFENDARLVASQRALGQPVYFGDVSRAELLRKVHAERAPAIVLTMDHAASVLNSVRGIRREFPDVPLFSRSRDEKHARLLKQAGASVVIPETLESSLQLSAFVLEAAGVDDDTVDAMLDTERARYAATLGEELPG